jgi:hypothetical protein
VAVASLVDVVPTEDLHWTGLWPRWAWQRGGAPVYPPQIPAEVADLSVVAPISDQSRGDFTPGRWAWLLDDVRKLDEPIPAKGHQGLWEWDGTAVEA